MILPPVDWRQREGLDALVAVLGSEDARVVGGAVRDTLLGLDVSDVDLATRHTPDDVMARLREAGIQVVPTGLAHGTVTAVLPSGPVEVTTLRRDVATDGRHAVVAFSDDWREDASRRDFTINALYADLSTGEISDWFGGLADLKAGRVRFIGDPLTRIAEDHLRILRFFRFHARFGDDIDEAGLVACQARANDLMALSRERIASELLRLLIARDAVRVVELMVERGILHAVLPEVDASGVEGLSRLAIREAEAEVPPDALRRLAALLPSQSAESVGARLKLSNAQRRRLIGATTGPGAEGPAGLAYRVGVPAALDRLLLAGAPIDPLTAWQPTMLPISGGDLVAMGIAQGPLVAATLRRIETAWIALGFPDRTALQSVIADAVAQAISANAASASSAGA